MSSGYWAPYVPVAQRRREANASMQKLKKKGFDVQPIEIEGRKIATTFWGIAWNEHLESFGDYANRIPRGRTYVRNGSVCHLGIRKGEIEARVSGSSIYQINISINPLPTKKWARVKTQCAGQVGSILELLQGRLSSAVMSVVTDKQSGLFPAPGEIDLNCSCPDVAYMCKHIAAVLYGVGARLDHQPELLFELRGVDHDELISADVTLTKPGKSKTGRRRITADSLADVFGIDLSAGDTPSATKITKKKTAKKKAAKKTAKKVAKKAAKKAGRKKVPRARTANGELIFTGGGITSLRERFRMTPIEFALLVGVSTLTITNWEAKSGALTLRARSRQALGEVERLSKRKAWDQLAGL